MALELFPQATGQWFITLKHYSGEFPALLPFPEFPSSGFQIRLLSLPFNSIKTHFPIVPNYSALFNNNRHEESSWPLCMPTLPLPTALALAFVYIPILKASRTIDNTQTRQNVHARPDNLSLPALQQRRDSSLQRQARTPRRYLRAWAHSQTWASSTMQEVHYKDDWSTHGFKLVSQQQWGWVPSSERV